MYNSKIIKNIICLMIIFWLAMSTQILSVVSPTKDFFINDYAGVLTDETRKHIVQTNIELQNKTGAQIVIVTVPSLDGQNIEEYATYY